MQDIFLEDRLFAKFDRGSNPMEAVTFSGPCIAVGRIDGGGDLDSNGRRVASVLTGYIGADDVASCGSVDYPGSAGHHSTGPASITIAVPLGHKGKFLVTGGKPRIFTVELVRRG